jgi:C4-type Zn-finger protein
MPVPELSPIIVHTLVCPTCGDQMEHKFIRTAKGKITESVFYCVRDGYKHMETLAYSHGTQHNLSQKELNEIRDEFMEKQSV